ncbi:MAG: SufE family protein [Salinisphaera sp.]|nr:SufE family protein [Salinisphaera sp.]
MDTELQKLKATFEMLPDWEERYRYIIDLGRKLDPLPEDAYKEENRVRGCMSQVWLIADDDDAARIVFRGDSDAHIVRGLIAILLKIYSGKSAQEIVDTDIKGIFEELALEQHITMNRRNGLYSMVEAIRRLGAQRLVVNA